MWKPFAPGLEVLLLKYQDAPLRTSPIRQRGLRDSYRQTAQPFQPPLTDPFLPFTLLSFVEVSKVERSRYLNQQRGLRRLLLSPELVRKCNRLTYMSTLENQTSDLVIGKAPITKYPSASVM